MDKLIRHATRTLVKNGHSGALELIGFKKGALVKVAHFNIDKKITTGEYLHFSFDLISTADKTQNIVIDYVIYFKKSDGSLSPKVFKMTTRKLDKNETVNLKKKHSFKVITTRTYYPGKHKLAIQVNGEEKATADFLLQSNH